MTGSINMGSNGLFNITNLHAIVGYYSPFYSTNPPASIQLYYDGNKASRVRIAAGGRVTVNKFGRGDDDVATMRDLPSIPAVDNLTLTRKGNTDSVSAWIVNNGLSVWYAANLASMATSFIDGPGYYFGDEGGISSNLSSGYTFLNPGYDGVLPGLPSTNGFTVPDDWNGVYGGHWTYSPAISATMGVPTFAQDDGANGSWMWWCPGSWNGGSWGWIIQAGTSPGIWSYAFIYNAALSAGGTQFYLPYQCDAVGYYAIGPINPHDYPIEADMGTPSTVRTMTLVSLPMQLGFTASNALCTIMLQTTNTTLTTNQVAVGIVDMTGGTTNWAGPLIRQSQTDINNSLWTAACNFYGSTNVVELAIVSSNAADIIVKGMAAPCN